MYNIDDNLILFSLNKYLAFLANLFLIIIYIFTTTNFRMNQKYYILLVKLFDIVKLH